MNSNDLIGYQGLINHNYSTSITSTDIVCDSISAQHYYNIFCQTIGVSFGNPEISLLYDELTNTFTLRVYSNSIPLSRLSVSMYDNLAVPSTLVFRDATNSTTLSNLTITGDINLGVGLSYKINGVAINTDNIQEAVNKYYTDARARLSISGTAPILYNNTTGVISLNTTIAQTTTFTAQTTFNNGNNVQGTTYSVFFGSGSKSAQLVLYDGLTYNSYAQVYCRSRNYGVQGNIDTISLEKATKIVTSLQITNVGLTANYCFIDSTGINIGVGESYKINGVTVDTDDIQESLTPTNKYYTDTRARLCVSGTAPIIYDAVGGVISLDTTINQATTFTSLLTTNSIKIKDLNYISITDITSGIDYFKADYTGVNISTGLTYKIGGVDLKTSDIGESVNLYYTDTRSRLALSLSTLAGSEVACSYNNSTGIITVPPITTNSILLSKLKSGSGNNIIVCNNSTGVPTYVTMSGDITTVNGVCLVGADKITTIKVLNGAIIPAKISVGTMGQILQTNTSLVNNWVSMTGDTIISGSGFTTISNDAITTVKVLNANITPIKISLGSVNQILQTNSSSVNNWVSLSGDATLTDGVMTIGNDKITTAKILNANITPAKISLGAVNQFLQTNLSLVNVWTTMTGDGGLANGILTITSGAISLLKIASSAYSQLASAFSTLVQRDSAGGINVERINAVQMILTNSPFGEMDATSVGKYVNITYPSISINLVPYCNTYATSLSGITASLTNLSPTWDRVKTTTNTLEVSMYSKGDAALWKIEGQLVNYYVSPGTACNITVAVFINAASTATITSSTARLVSSLFVNRNIGGINTTYVTPFTCYYSIGGAPYPEGTCFTFTVYVSGNNGGALACGRSSNDIPSNICVTQLN